MQKLADMERISREEFEKDTNKYLDLVSTWDKCFVITEEEEDSMVMLPYEDILFMDEDFGTMLNCAVRYGLGRQTYMPDVITSYFTLHIPNLSDRTLFVALRDIVQHGEWGHDLNAGVWKRFKETLIETLTKRGVNINDILKTDNSYVKLDS